MANDNQNTKSISIGSVIAIDPLYAGFSNMLGGILPDSVEHIAIGLSGGPDSMALLWLLNEWVLQKDIQIHALHVDHSLRKESAKEAVTLGSYLKGLDYVKYISLKRDITNLNKNSKIQEKAREDRYALMTEYCVEHNIRHLCLAHHQDDQAETFLFRLAKGSGLDGLSSMHVTQDYNGQFTLVRPLLWAQKASLVKFCETYNVPYLNDPSNKNEHFARVRLRQSADILAEEGLSAKRLSVTAGRLARARKALDIYANNLFELARVETEQEMSPDRIVFEFDIAQQCPSETRLRLLQITLNKLVPTTYGPRMEKLEALEQRIFETDDFTKLTLGGCIFTRKYEDNKLVIEREERNCAR